MKFSTKNALPAFVIFGLVYLFLFLALGGNAGAAHMHASGIGAGGALLGIIAPFPVIPELTAIAVMYKNIKYIADNVLIRTPPVSKESFRWRKYDLAQAFTIPNTKVARTSKPNQVEFGFTEEDASTLDYALDEPVPQSDILNAAGTNYDPLGRATEMTAELIALDREKRVADLVFDSSNYDDTNVNDLTEDYKWQSKASGYKSDPVADIEGGLDKMVIRANTMVIGRPLYTALRTHPQILKSVNRNLGDSGVARRQDMADLFELDNIFVGESWANSAKKGQAPALYRLWGTFCALLYINPLATNTGGLSWGYTVPFGTRVAGAMPDKDIGMRGGQMVRVGESVKEIVAAKSCGYLIESDALEAD
jgi:hypothetical protein